MQHSGHADVLDINMLAADFIRDVITRDASANYFIGADRLQRRCSSKRHMEWLVAQKRAIDNGPCRVVNHRHHPIENSQTVNWCV